MQLISIIFFASLFLQSLLTANYSVKKEIVFLAGKKSHGYGTHEHRAGSLLLAKCFNESGLQVQADVVDQGVWPIDREIPDAIVLYCDGLKRHIARAHQEEIQSWVDKGVGVSCLHFGVEVEPEQLGSTFFNWIGGYFEAGWSVNPHWDATFDQLPEHPITNGVDAFTIRDEWYYHMRFRPNMEGVTPILSALPPMETLTSRAQDKLRGSNPHVMASVKAGVRQHLAWAYERPDGGRGFGFTGGHFHKNWQHNDFRKLVLNAILWTAHGKIPVKGVPSKTPTDAEMEKNQDFPKPKS